MGDRHSHTRSLIEIDADGARAVAQTMHALSTASRVMILGQLARAPRTVGELTALTDMLQPAVSQQLRVLRHLGLVVAKRAGRHMVYELHDHHVAELLEQAVFHTEHVVGARIDASPAEDAA